MMRKIIPLFFIFLSLLCSKALAAGAGTCIKDYCFSHEPAKGLIIEKLDLQIKPFATYVVQGVSHPNNANSSQFSGAWRMELDIIKGFGEWAEAKVRLMVGDHSSVTNKINAFSNVDYNAHNSHDDISAHTFWYKQYLFQKQFSVVVGKLDPTDWFDLNNYANNHRTQFLADVFNNSPVIEWPVNDSFGVHMEASPESLEFMQFTFDYFDEDWKSAFHHSVFTGGINFRPAYLLGKDTKLWDGNYRLSGWVNNTPHAKLVQAGGTQGDADKINYGVNLSCDQEITDVFGVFGRFGWQRPDVAMPGGSATLEWLWSLGARMSGKYWNRDNDVVGLAMAQLVPSKEYKDAGHPGSAEGHLELYYNYKLNAYLSITPDLQFIWNPDGNRASDTIAVYGARAQVYF